MNGRLPIVLIEDNPDDVLLTLRAFEQNRITNDVVVAEDGARALELLLGEKPVRPAMVLLDLNLPKIGGLDVLRRLRQEPATSLLPVVILTSSREEQDLVSGYSLGANSYVRKPVDFDQFVEAVKQLGLYWLVLNEPPPV
jgi:two-component system response regulator